MSLQRLINWWLAYSKKHREIVSCGAWPAAVPPWADIFLPCCINHDAEYVASETMYVDGVLDRDEDLKNRALEIKDIADCEFTSCVRARYRNSWLLFRPLSKAWGEQYIELVSANGDRIWFQSVGMQIAEIESGNKPTVKVALRKATLAGRVI